MFLPLRRARWPLHTKMGRICKVAVEMTRRINRGESQTGYSPALGNPHQTRVPTFPQRRRRRGAWQRRGQTPLKSGSLPDSCTEPLIEGRVSYDVAVLLDYIRKNTRMPSVRAMQEDTRGVV